MSANEDDVERRRRDQLIGGRQPLLNPARTKKQESGEFRANYSTQNVSFHFHFYYAILLFKCVEIHVKCEKKKNLAILASILVFF